MNDTDLAVVPEVDDSAIRRREIAMLAIERYQKMVGNSDVERLETLEKKAEEIRLEFRAIRDKIAEIKAKPSLEETGMQVATQLLDLVPNADIDFVIAALERRFGQIPPATVESQPKLQASKPPPAEPPAEKAKQVSLFAPKRLHLQPQISKPEVMAAVSTEPEKISVIEATMGWKGHRNHLRDALAELVAEGKVIREGEKHATTYRKPGRV